MRRILVNNMQTTTPPRPTLSVANKRSAASQLDKIRGSQTILSIFILLLVAVLLWIVVSIFSSHRTTQISSDTSELAKPLSPNLSTEVLDVLDSKRAFTERELRDFPIYVIMRDSQSQAEQVILLGSQPATIFPELQTSPEPTTTPLEPSDSDVPSTTDTETPPATEPELTTEASEPAQ